MSGGLEGRKLIFIVLLSILYLICFAILILKIGSLSTIFIAILTFGIPLIPVGLSIIVIVCGVSGRSSRGHLPKIQLKFKLC